MTHILRTKLFLVLCVSTLCAPLVAHAELFPEVELNEIATTTQTASAEGGLTFLYGEEVNTASPAPSDLFASGYSIVVDEAVGGDVFAAGNTVIIDDAVDGSLRIAANSVTVSNRVQGNALIFANTVVLDTHASVNGHLTVYANQVTINGAVEKTTTIGAGHVTINGLQRGTASINAEVVSFGSDAQLVSPFSVTSPTTPLLDEGAVGTEQMQYKKSESTYSKSRSGATQHEMLTWFFSFVFFSVIGVILLLLWPSLFARVAHVMEKEHSTSWIKGAVFLIVTPVAALVLMCTIVGIPFALVGMMLYVVLLLMGRLCVAWWIGKHLSPHTSKKLTRMQTIMTFVVGYFILSVLVSLPWIGWLLSLLAGVWGVGGILHLRSQMRQAR